MRQITAFAVGLPRSGGRILHNMFAAYRTQFEPLADQFIDVIMSGDDGYTDRFLRNKDQLKLDMEISHFNTHVLDKLVKLFPDAKFILTVRDCFGWICNAIDYCRNSTGNDRLFCDWLFATRDMVFPEEELPLAEDNYYPIAGYLSAWERYNNLVLDSVPKDRLLVCKMFNMNEKRSAIAKFLGIDENTLGIGHEQSCNLNLQNVLSHEYIREKIDSVSKTRARLDF